MRVLVLLGVKQRRVTAPLCHFAPQNNPDAIGSSGTGAFLDLKFGRHGLGLGNVENYSSGWGEGCMKIASEDGRMVPCRKVTCTTPVESIAPGSP